MPFRRERSAPTDLTDPCLIFRYFEDLEDLFAKHNISDTQEKKQAAVYYPSVKVEALWKTTLTFSDPTYSYEDFKVKIIALYLEAEPQHTLEELEKLVADRARTPIRSREELGEYNRNFLLVLHFLISKDRISWIDQSHYFLASFEPILAMAIRSQLERKFPDHFPVDPYKTEDIYTAALNALEWQRHAPLTQVLRILSPTFPTPATTQQMPPPQAQACPAALRFMQAETPATVPALVIQQAAPLAHVPRDVPPPPVLTPDVPAPVLHPLSPIHTFLPVLKSPQPLQTDPTDVTLDRLIEVIASIKALEVNRAVPFAEKSAKSHSRQSDAVRSQAPCCKFCGSPEHLVEVCKEVNRYILTGMCKRSVFGKVVLPSGAELPRHIKGKGLQERFEE